MLVMLLQQLVPFQSQIREEAIAKGISCIETHVQVLDRDRKIVVDSRCIVLEFRSKQLRQGSSARRNARRQP